MKKMFGVSMLLMCFSAGMLSAQTNPTYTCYKTTEPIVLDGVPNEAAWTHADSGVLRKVRRTTDVAGDSLLTVYFKAVYDSQYLYLYTYSDCKYLWNMIPKTNGPVDTEYIGLWDENCVEFFIDPNGTNQYYIEAHIAPRGDMVSEELPYLGEPWNNVNQYTWNFDFDKDSVRTVNHGTFQPDSLAHLNNLDIDTGWSAETRFDFASFKKTSVVDYNYNPPTHSLSILAAGQHAPPDSGESWKLGVYNILHTLGSNHRTIYYGWSFNNQLAGDFHRTTDYGTLQFAGIYVPPIAIKSRPEESNKYMVDVLSKTSRSMTWSLPPTMGASRVIAYTAEGTIVFNGVFTKTFTINTAQLSNGVYMINVGTGNNKVTRTFTVIR